MGQLVLLVSFFHAAMLGTAVFFAKAIDLDRKRKTALIFMGSQKTLPLSVLVQATLFPSLGLSLAVCVVHHVVHLMTDAYLVGRMGSRVK